MFPLVAALKDRLDRTYLCRKCRRRIFDGTEVSHHLSKRTIFTLTKQANGVEYSGSPMDIVCTHEFLFADTPKWATNQDFTEHEGKVYCRMAPCAA